LPCLVLGVDATLLWTRRRGVRIALGALIALLIAGNLRTVWFDNSVYLLGAYHPVLYESRTHVGAITEDLRELSAAPRIEELRGGGRAAVIVGDFVAWRRTDRDLVTLQYLHHALRGYFVLHNPKPEEWRARRPVLAVVFRGFDLPAGAAEGARVVLSNGSFTLHELPGVSP
jgi:hypothetical protein